MSSNNVLIAFAVGLLISSVGIARVYVKSEPERHTEPDVVREFNEPQSGAIFTTLKDGSSVNNNVYQREEDAYLDGGPGRRALASATGLAEGDYYFQVTDPSGKALLSTDHISCREVHVNANGVISRSYSGTNYLWRRGAWAQSACQHQIGVDLDHADEGAITVQLMPYDETPSSGGVYKIWFTPADEYIGDPDFRPSSDTVEINGAQCEPDNFHGFVPAHSKTDNYKVRRSGTPQLLTLRKFHDANANGAMDLDEQEISGWETEINDPAGANNRYYTPATLYVSEGIWIARETTLAGTTVTAAILDGAPQSTYPNADPLARITVEGAKDGHHELLWGDVGLGAIWACKVYDVDADGKVDEGERGLEGWRFELGGTNVRGETVGPIVQATGQEGCTGFVDLLPGEYTVRDLSSGGDWIATGPTSQRVTISSTLHGSTLLGTQAAVSFTNYCKGRAAFATKGDWHSHDGLDELEDADIAYVNSLLPYSQPSSYFDVGEEPFDGLGADAGEVPWAYGPIGRALTAAGSARAEVSRFLIDATTSEDSREQLAQQLLAFIFNTRRRLSGQDANVALPGGGFVVASDLIHEAIGAWLFDDAAAQDAIKTTLEALNESDEVSFVRSSPCALP